MDLVSSLKLENFDKFLEMNYDFKQNFFISSEFFYRILITHNLVES
jgi:hypothetical protein